MSSCSVGPSSAGTSSSPSSPASSTRGGGWEPPLPPMTTSSGSSSALGVAGCGTSAAVVLVAGPALGAAAAPPAPTAPPHLPPDLLATSWKPSSSSTGVLGPLPPPLPPPGSLGAVSPSDCATVGFRAATPAQVEASTGLLPPAPTGASLSRTAGPPAAPIVCTGRPHVVVPCGLSPPSPGPGCDNGGRPRAKRSLGGGGLPRPPTSPALLPALATPPRTAAPRRASPPVAALAPLRATPHSKQLWRRAKFFAKPHSGQAQSGPLEDTAPAVGGPPPPLPPPPPLFPPPDPVPPGLVDCP